MKISASEQQALREVLAHGETWGYGNLISHLQTAWARRLVSQGMPETVARASTARDGSSYPFLMQDDLIQRGEWDETGARYAVPTAKRKKAKKLIPRGGRRAQP